MVTNRAELVAALNNGVYPPPPSTPSNAPKIIYVDGTIDANVDDDNQPLTCATTSANGYTSRPSSPPTTRRPGAA